MTIVWLFRQIGMRGYPKATQGQPLRARETQDGGSGANVPLSSAQGEQAGVTLIELLCVMGIIAILASMLFPTIFRVFERIKGQPEEIEADGIAEMLLKETRSYCAAHPRYSFGTKSELADNCGLAPKPRTWVQAASTEFVPFNDTSPTNLIVLSVHIGRKHATLYQFTKEELPVTPQRR